MEAKEFDEQMRNINTKDEIQKRTELFQQQCHEQTSQVVAKMNENIGTAYQRYEAAKDVWFYNKLAALELRIEKLEEAESDRELVRQGY